MGMVKAGAGKAVIELPMSLFPLEGYEGAADPIHLRILIIEEEKKSVIVSLEIPSVREEGLLKWLWRITSEETGAEEENVWICATHNLGTIHIPTAENSSKRRIFLESLEKALRTACRAAMGQIQPVRIGKGISWCDVNTNRDISSNQGWWNGLRGEGEEDKTLTVLRFETMEKKLLAVLYHYPVKSCSVSGAKNEHGMHLSTSEITGKSSEYVEEKTNAPALFFMGAAADMVPAQCACYWETDENGNLREVSLPLETGLKYRKTLGEILGNAVCNTLMKTECSDQVFVWQERRKLWYEGQQFYNEGKPYHPTPEYRYIPTEREELTVHVLCLGDTLFLGLQPETTAVIGRKLREKVRDLHTLVVAMVNGGKDYMADELSYDRRTFSGTHSVFARGSAEQFINDAAKIAEEVLEMKSQSNG